MKLKFGNPKIKGGHYNITFGERTKSRNREATVICHLGKNDMVETY